MSALVDRRALGGLGCVGASGCAIAHGPLGVRRCPVCCTLRNALGSPAVGLARLCVWAGLLVFGWAWFVVSMSGVHDGGIHGVVHGIHRSWCPRWCP